VSGAPPIVSTAADREVEPAEAASPHGTATAEPLFVAPGDGAMPTDPLAILYLCESNDAEANVRTGTAKVNGLENQRHEALAKEQKAIQDSIQAEHDKSFWDDMANVCSKIAEVAAVVASVAAVVATAGAATPLSAVAIAGCVMSSASIVDGEAHVLQKLGVDANAAGWIDLGLSLGGAGCSVGVTLAAGAKAASGFASTVGRIGVVVSGAAQAGRGSAEIAAGVDQQKEENDQADAAAADLSWNLLLRRIQTTLDDTQASDDQSQRVKGVLRDTMATRDATLDSALFQPSSEP
jgi:hypothetical protein